jgi:hypothetical protein
MSFWRTLSDGDSLLELDVSMHKDSGIFSRNQWIRIKILAQVVDTPENAGFEQ